MPGRYSARRLPLFRRRAIWLPTVWGALLLLALTIAAVCAIGASAYRFLALNEPARGPDGSGARTLVVEGWLDPPQLAVAVAAFRRGRYDRVLTTGGPIDPWIDAGGWGNFALRAAHLLRSQGLVEVPVIAVPAPETQRDRTYLSATMVREWAVRSKIELGAVDVHSVGPHARRTRALYRLALGDAVEVGVLAAPPRGGGFERWWASSEAAKSVSTEALGLAWTTCCFWPERPAP